MRSVILLGIAAMFLLAYSSPVMACALPEQPLGDCGDCRDHGGNIHECVCDGDANMIPPLELVAPDRPQWLTRIALKFLLLTSIR
jgi:hypothetical protein